MHTRGFANIARRTCGRRRTSCVRTRACEEAGRSGGGEGPRSASRARARVLPRGAARGGRRCGRGEGRGRGESSPGTPGNRVPSALPARSSLRLSPPLSASLRFSVRPLSAVFGGGFWLSAELPTHPSIGVSVGFWAVLRRRTAAFPWVDRPRGWFVRGRSMDGWMRVVPGVEPLRGVYAVCPRMPGVACKLTSASRTSARDALEYWVPRSGTRIADGFVVAVQLSDERGRRRVKHRIHWALRSGRNCPWHGGFWYGFGFAKS